MATDSKYGKVSKGIKNFKYNKKDKKNRRFNSNKNKEFFKQNIYI